MRVPLCLVFTIAVLLGNKVIFYQLYPLKLRIIFDFRRRNSPQAVVLGTAAVRHHPLLRYQTVKTVKLFQSTFGKEHSSPFSIISLYIWI